MKLHLKKAYKRLGKGEREGFFDDISILSTINPFKWKYYIVFILVVPLLAGLYKIFVALLLLYVIWIFLYGVTFLGIYFQFKYRLGKTKFKDMWSKYKK